MTKEQRAEIFRETIACCKAKKYTNQQGEEVELPMEDYGMNHNDSVIYDANIYHLVRDEHDNYPETVIEVKNIDCLYAACDMIDDGYNPAVLNMASYKNPGGGVQKGSSAQEESLCRRTNLYETIAKFDTGKTKKSYPLDINYGAIYSPVVSVFRKSEADGCAFMNKPYTIDVITAAAIKHPQLDVNGRIDRKPRLILRNKIRTIMNLAIYYRNDSLVLGAFGCGAYGTPPNDMAEIFKEVLNEKAYKHAFRKIVFAIIDDANAHREHNPEGNFVPFWRTFNGE